MENKIALSTAAAFALCCAGAFADGLPGRIEYAVNFGRETQAVGRFLPVGSTYWQEGKAWNQEFTAASTTAASGYEDEAAIYRTYIYPNDSTAGLTATYVLPGLEANASYTLRVHVLEVYMQWAQSRLFDVTVNGETKVSSLDIYSLAGDERYKGAYIDIPVSADAEGRLTIGFVNVKDQFNVAAIEVFSDTNALPAPSPRIRRESRGVNVVTVETRNAAYLYDIEYRTGDTGTVNTLKSGVSGLRVVHTNGKATTQYRARAVLGSAKGEWSDWTPVDSSAYASDVAIRIACAESGKAAPEGWLKDTPFRVFPAGATIDYYENWIVYNLSNNYAVAERPSNDVFALAVKSGSNLAYRVTGLDPARSYRVRIHQMEPWTAVNSGGWRYFAYHFNNALDKATALTGETQVDPYVLAGNATCCGAAVDYEVTPDSAGTILVAGENLKDVPYWFGFEITPLGEVVDPPPPGLTIIFR